MSRNDIMEILVTVVAIIVGLVVGKMVSRGLMMAGVPIAAGDPIPVPITKKAA